MTSLLCSLAAVLALAANAASPMPPPKHGGIYVVAHRGAHEGIPENTLAAYRKAIELGVDYVEIDLRTTKDGRLVSVHNSTVDAYTNDATGPVRDFTLAELRAMDIGSRVGPEWRNERIPTFEEILDLCKGKCGVYLDLKDADVAQAVALIKARGMEGDVVWYADLRELEELAKHCPKCIPMPDPGPEALLPRVLETKPPVVATVWKYFSATFAKTCHDAGAIVVMDESDPSCWDQALAWGVDGIQTDHPKDLVEYLDKRAEKK